MWSRTEFDRVAPILERALRYDPEWTLEAIAGQLEAGMMQLWPGERSAVVTEVLVRPKARVLFFFLAAGEMDEIKRLYHLILAWGRERGCTRASFAGRYGWARSFLTKEEGWHTKLALFEKEL
jgi:hypothetical protein